MEKYSLLYNTIGEKWNLLHLEAVYSVEEEMVQFKGSRNFKQYFKNIPIKWGAKIVSDWSVWDDLWLYNLSRSFYGIQTWICIVWCRICSYYAFENIPLHSGLFFENYFGFYWLFEELSKETQIYGAGTIQKYPNHRLQSVRTIIKRGRNNKGFMENKIGRNCAVVLIKWVQGSVATFSSNLVGVAPHHMYQRWGQKNT